MDYTANETCLWCYWRAEHKCCHDMSGRFQQPVEMDHCCQQWRLTNEINSVRAELERGRMDSIVEAMRWGRLD